MIKKISTYSTFALALTLGLTGCSQEEMIDAATNEKELVQFSAGVETTVAEANVETRSTTQGDIAAFINKEFTMIVADGRAAGVTPFESIAGTATTTTTLTGTSIDAITNESMEAGGVDPAKIDFTPSLYWDDLGGRGANLTLYGIYPKQDNATKNTRTLIWTVANDQSSSEATPGANPNDLLLAHRKDYTYGKRAIAANLHFKHVLTKITLHVKAGSNFTTPFDPSVSLVNLPNTGTVNLTPATIGEVEYPFTETATVASITPTKTKSTDNTHTFTVIVLPNELTADQVFAKVTVGGNTFNISTSQDTPLKAGDNNVFNVTINKSDVATSATVAGWNDVTPIDIEKQLITPEITDFEASGDIKKGSKLYVTLTDKNTPATIHEVTYTATPKQGDETKLQWVAEKPLYWDDIATNNTVNFTATAILNNGSSNAKEDLYESAEVTVNAISPKIVFTDMTHAMSKVVIYIRTNNDGADVVTYPSTQGSTTDKVFLPAYEDCTINGSTITDTNPATADITLAHQRSGVTITTKPGIIWDEYITYIKPQTIATSEILLNVKVGNNEYPVTAKEAKEFVKHKSNIFYVTIKKSIISTSATITAWGDVENGDINTDLGGSTQK